MGKKITLLLLSALLALPHFFTADINGTAPYNGREKFDPSLSRLSSLQALESYTDSIARSRSIAIPSPQYLLVMEEVISHRFYHGFSHWKMNENWIAAFGQKISGIGVACKVRANDILKDPNAACSQQALVTMAMLRKKGIEYRPVFFPHHYALEAHVGDRWYYLDANMEPVIGLTERMHRNWRSNNDTIKKYFPAVDHAELNYRFGQSEKATLGPVNDRPAGNARAFQGVTGILSRFGWAIPLLLLLVWRNKKVKGLSSSGQQ